MFANKGFGFTRASAQGIAASWVSTFNNIIDAQPGMPEVMIFMYDHNSKTEGMQQAAGSVTSSIQTVGVAVGFEGQWGLVTFAPHGVMDYAPEADRVAYMNSSPAVVPAVKKVAVEKNVEHGAVHFSSALVDTVGLRPDQPNDAHQLLSVLFSRAFDALNRVVAEQKKEPVPNMIDFQEMARTVMFSQRVTWEGHPDLRDVLGKLVRNDYVFTLTGKETARRHNVMEPAEVTLLRVSGYVDFKRAPSDTVVGQPWIVESPRYLPEFIITDIDNGGSEVVTMHEQQATVFALTMVAEFMRSGQWVQRFLPHLKTHSANDLSLLLDERDRMDFLREPHQNGYAAITQLCSHILNPGFLLSIDIPDNPTNATELKTLTEVVLRHSMSIGTMIDVVATSVGQSDFYSRHRNNFGLQSPYLTPVTVPMGNMFIKEKEGLYEYDVRQMDTLRALYVYNDRDGEPKEGVALTQQAVSDYLDLFYFQPSPNGMRCYGHPAHHRKGHTDFLARLDIKPEYYNTAYRTTFDGQFVNLLTNMLAASGLRINMVDKPKQTLTVPHQAIVL